MVRTKKQIINQTVDQLQVEAEKKGLCNVTESGQIIHKVEPIPDHDWKGETWGLYWSDYEDELRELIEENTEKYIKKHPDDKCKSRILVVTSHQCPVRPRSPTPTPLPEPAPRPRHQPVLEVHPPQAQQIVPEFQIAILGVILNFDMSSYQSTNNYRNIHKEGLNKHLVADVSEVRALTCPVPKVKKAPSPPPLVLPNIKLRDNAQHPGLPDIFEDVIGAQEVMARERDSKWGWMKEDDISVGVTKNRLSIFW